MELAANNLDSRLFPGRPRRDPVWVAGRRLVSIEVPPLLVLAIARPLALGILDPPPRKGKG